MLAELWTVPDKISSAVIAWKSGGKRCIGCKRDAAIWKSWIVSVMPPLSIQNFV